VVHAKHEACLAWESAAGAEILKGLTDRDYGSRECICQDPEGNVWCAGTHWPKVGAPSSRGMLASILEILELDPSEGQVAPGWTAARGRITQVVIRERGRDDGTRAARR
jgi:hypothetical protein